VAFGDVGAEVGHGEGGDLWDQGVGHDNDGLAVGDAGPVNGVAGDLDGAVLALVEGWALVAVSAALDANSGQLAGDLAGHGSPCDVGDVVRSLPAPPR